MALVCYWPRFRGEAQTVDPHHGQKVGCPRAPPWRRGAKLIGPTGRKNFLRFHTDMPDCRFVGRSPRTVRRSNSDPSFRLLNKTNNKETIERNAFSDNRVRSA